MGNVLQSAACLFLDPLCRKQKCMRFFVGNAFEIPSEPNDKLEEIVKSHM